MSYILIFSLVVTGLFLFAGLRLVCHQRRDAQMHRFVDRVMASREDQKDGG